MICSPSTSQLVQSVAAELRAKVVPQLTDPALLVELHMMLSVLDMVAVRTDNETAWMLDEADEVVAVLSEASVADQLSAPVLEALGQLRESQPADLTYAEVRRHYALASEVLARASDCALAGEPGLQPVVWSLLERRLEHELATIGTFVAVGRSENQP